MKSNFKMVQEFHRKFGIISYDGDPPTDVYEYRVKFMEEELNEFKKAYFNEDREEQLDALVDLIYVALGTCDLFGFKFDEAFERVHNCNMLKRRAKNEGESKRNHSLDVVKPDGWIPPVLEDLV